MNEIRQITRLDELALRFSNVMARRLRSRGSRQASRR